MVVNCVFLGKLFMLDFMFDVSGQKVIQVMKKVGLIEFLIMFVESFGVNLVVVMLQFLEVIMMLQQVGFVEFGNFGWLLRG